MIYLGNQKSGTLTLPQPGAATEKFVPRIGDNGNWYVYDFKENTYVDTGVSAQGPQGEQGEMGAVGESGYTPVRGVDYWTDDDKAEIVGDVKDELDFDAKIADLEGGINNAQSTANDATSLANIAAARAEEAYIRADDASSLAGTAFSEAGAACQAVSRLTVLIITETEADGTLYLEHNQEARLAAVPEVDDVPTLSLVLPDTITQDYESYLCFTSGDVATNVIYSGIKFVGVDCDSDGVFSPMANVNYEIAFKNLGTGDSPNIIARVGSW